MPDAAGSGALPFSSNCSGRSGRNSHCKLLGNPGYRQNGCWLASARPRLRFVQSHAQHAAFTARSAAAGSASAGKRIHHRLTCACLTRLRALRRDRPDARRALGDQPLQPCLQRRAPTGVGQLRAQPFAWAASPWARRDFGQAIEHLWFRRGAIRWARFEAEDAPSRSPRSAAAGHW